MLDKKALAFEELKPVQIKIYKRDYQLLKELANENKTTFEIMMRTAILYFLNNWWELQPNDQKALVYSSIFSSELLRTFKKFVKWEVKKCKKD